MNLQPNVSMQNYSWPAQDILKKKPKRKGKNKKKNYQVLLNDTSHKLQVSKKDKDISEKLLELKNKHHINITNDKNQDHLDNDNFFCNLPTSSYARVIIGVNTEKDSGNDLWSIEGVLAQCHIDDVLRANTHFPTLCQTQVEHNDMEHNKCCRSWSPANYVAFLSNRSSCLGVTESDLIKVKALLQQCAHYYYNHQLSSNCAEDFNCQKHVPNECYMRNAVYHLLHYLLDINFIPKHVSMFF